ncbi:MAG TPA: serine/threonine-protein kinase, partial [Holophaga sp.]|nr:serine/threonine-protein kinase [Holophaga sp.]
MAKQLGKYEILRTLGQGAMGEVYLAHHPTIGRDVAIKTILPSAARGDDAEDRFRREAAAAGKLNHPNLVTIYDFDKDGDVLYLVMEYVKGDDLEDLILNRELSQSQFLEVLAQICDGLSFAHRSGIIHRDIKPSNVRVIRDGKRLLAKVMDFGIARVEDSGMTATGIVMGTVSYMAPEYIQSGKAVAQCDLWAVGVMLYEYLAGRKPFFADNTT